MTGNTVISPPASDGAMIYFCGDKTAGGLAPGAVAPRWQFKLAEDAALQFRPRVGNGRVVFCGQRGIAVHDATDGKLIWQRAAAIQTGVPMVNDTQVVLGDGHEIVALELATGIEQWRHAGVPDTLTNYAPVQSGSAILAAPGDGRLYALDAASGRLLWQRNGIDDWQYLRQLRVHKDILVGGSYKEKLFGISISDGRELWQFNAGNFINSHLVADGTAYLWSPTGFIYAIDAETGAIRWRHETTDYDDNHANWGPLMAELVVVNGKLLALDMFDVLHVLDTVDGKALAHVKVPAKIRHAVLPLAQDGLAFPTHQGEIVLTDGV
ncbi:MAG: PQQ-binding-like beta-propeller repeat protein [Phyllobacteriaceae bacterium]|nr:PQQ-binding-like beta-propeller repeat protein [Phyllobacteriaceae bacterium]